MDLLAEPSRRFAEGLLKRLPELADHAGMESRRADGLFDLVIRIPAPPGDRNLDLHIRMERGEEPPLNFGSWRTRELLWSSRNNEVSPRDGMYSLIESILGDRVLLCEEIWGKHDGVARIVDLRIPDALLEITNRPPSSGRLRLVSWSGDLDLRIQIEDLEERWTLVN